MALRAFGWVAGVDIIHIIIRCVDVLAVLGLSYCCAVLCCAVFLVFRNGRDYSTLTHSPTPPLTLPACHFRRFTIFLEGLIAST
jgi:hypothetical protein